MARRACEGPRNLADPIPRTSPNEVLGRPGTFLNTAADVSILPRVLDAASRFEKRPSEAEMQALLRERDVAPLFT